MVGSVSRTRTSVLRRSDEAFRTLRMSSVKGEGETDRFSTSEEKNQTEKYLILGYFNLMNFHSLLVTIPQKSEQKQQQNQTKDKILLGPRIVRRNPVPTKTLSDRGEKNRRLKYNTSRD